MSNVADDIVSALNRIPGALEDAFPRSAHKARLEQIAAHTASLAHLVGQLPGEEEREADFERRLLEDHEAGKIDPRAQADGDPESARKLAHPQASMERLAEALQNRKG